MTTPADPLALLRSRAYVRLLAVAAILGVPISAAAWGFLALVSYLQKELFTHLPHGLGYSTAPAWWPLPMLIIGGVLAALAIRYLPGHGGASPAPGFAVHPAPYPGPAPPCHLRGAGVAGVRRRVMIARQLACFQRGRQASG